MDRFLDKPRVPAGSEWFFTSEIVQVYLTVSRALGYLLSVALGNRFTIESLENENLPDFTDFLERRALNFLLISIVRMSEV